MQSMVCFSNVETLADPTTSLIHNFGHLGNKKEFLPLILALSAFKSVKTSLVTPISHYYSDRHDIDKMHFLTSFKKILWAGSE